MKKNVLGFVTAINTVALVGIAIVSVPDDGAVEEQVSAQTSTAPDVGDLERRVAALEERLASEEPPATPSEVPQPQEAPLKTPSPETAAAALPNDAPVTRGQVEELVKAQLAAQADDTKRKWAEAAKARKRPKKTIAEVARELQLDPRQETAIRALYRDLERQSIRTLFAVEEEELESLKAQIAQSEHDPRLKAELRERIAVNWTRNGKEISVLYVQLDAQLRQVMDSDTLARFYRSDVELEEQEFPDIEATFFPEKQDDDDDDK